MDCEKGSRLVGTFWAKEQSISLISRAIIALVFLRRYKKKNLFVNLRGHDRFSKGCAINIDIIITEYRVIPVFNKLHLNQTKHLLIFFFTRN